MPAQQLMKGALVTYHDPDGNDYTALVIDHTGTHPAHDDVDDDGNVITHHDAGTDKCDLVVFRPEQNNFKYVLGVPHYINHEESSENTWQG